MEPREYFEVNALGAALAALMNRGNIDDPLELRISMLGRIAEKAALPSTAAGGWRCGER